jgi:hypothetical protein
METKDGTPADLCDEMDLWHAASNSSLVKLFSLISAYDRDQLWRTDGATSMPAWLSFRFGLAPSTAREWLRIGQVLPGLPAVQREFAEGRLSLDQLRFVCRLASQESDEFWAAEAVKYTAPQLELMARRRREITAAESNEAHRQRFHRMRWDPEHRVLRYRGMLPEEQGAILESAINRLVDQAGKDPLTGLSSLTSIPERPTPWWSWPRRASGRIRIRIGPPWWSTCPSTHSSPVSVLARSSPDPDYRSRRSAGCPVMAGSR